MGDKKVKKQRVVRRYVVVFAKTFHELLAIYLMPGVPYHELDHTVLR
jgi:hypothetical protein